MTETFDEQYFVENYRNYSAQNPTHKLEFYRQLLRQHFENGAAVTLLDVGCGPGAFLAHLERTEPSWRLFGSDVSTYAAERARVVSPAVEVFRASATDRPMIAESCDVVTAWDVLEHVPDLEAAAGAISQMLVHDGVFSFVVPVYDGPIGAIVGYLDRDPTHIHKLGRDDWLHWATGHFNVVSWGGIFRVLLPGEVYLHFPVRRLRTHSPAIAVVCRRR